MSLEPNAELIVGLLDHFEAFLDKAGAPLTEEQRKALASARGDVITAMPS